MKIKDLRAFLSKLPIEFDEFSMSNGEFGKVDKEDDMYYRLDKPIVTLYVDEENKELCFLHQTEDEISEIEGLSNNNSTEENDILPSSKE